MKQNTLNNFDQISNYSIYSKLNSYCDRIMKEKSLKGFVKLNNFVYHNSICFIAQ